MLIAITEQCAHFDLLQASITSILTREQEQSSDLIQATITYLYAE
jgi:hypothetical protein